MIIKSFKFTMLATGVLTAALSLTACEKSGGENEDLASAQSCLDQVPQNNPASAAACLPLVEGYDSAAANALKCSIYMTSGGLIESKIVNAYNALKNGGDANKEATFMALLSLDVPDVTSAYRTAVTGNQFCKVSTSKGLVFVGATIVAGTYLAKVIKESTGSAINMNDPAGVAAAVQTMLATCSSASPDPACSTDVTTLGATTVALADAYCGNSSADQAVCGKINAAVVAANGDDAKVGKALYCYLAQKSYDAATDACVAN